MSAVIDKCTVIIPVYITQVSGLNGPIVWNNLEDAIEELRNLSLELLDSGTTFTVKAETMPRYEYNQLEEFEGY